MTKMVMKVNLVNNKQESKTRCDSSLSAHTEEFATGLPGPLPNPFSDGISGQC